ncbi:MAG: aspartate carbamoyltransferase [Chloroflexota bacterium]
MLVPDPTPPISRRRWPWLVLAAVVAAGVIGGGYLLADRLLNPQAGMDARAAQVMPFDLNATTHTFTKTDQGGVEEVVALDPADARNIDLIRSHLEYEATEFRKGNFSDPATIHGMDMPGLQDLEAGASRIDVRFESLPAGGRITYSSDDPALVAALHSWFDRQTTDHAMPGMGG